MPGFNVLANITWTDQTSGKVLGGTVNLTAAYEINVSINVPPTTTNEQFTISFIAANLVAIMLFSNQNLVLDFNSYGAPAPLIDLTANNPYFWYLGSGEANPFSVNITTAYASNPGSLAADLEIRGLTN